ncbi:NAD-dependent protein deacetylase sirtuin-2-like isoform X2 [Lineus longissimus]
MELLRKKFADSFKVEDQEKPDQLLKTVDFDGVVKYLKDGKCKNIIFMTGAGISTSAGIPDFRSPGTGLYANLEKYNLPNPMAIFDISYFRENPEPFFTLAKELWPADGLFKPTPCHYFMRLIHEKGMLRKLFTQNIDTFERVAEIPTDKIMEAHGSFHTSHCIECDKCYTQDWIKEKIFSDVLPKCEAEDCEGVVKPDVVFFGEALPAAFFQSIKKDMPECDLLIIMGTSLAVQPFASMVGQVPETTPRLYINLQKTGQGDPLLALLGMGGGLQFDQENNYRDVFWQGTCDDGSYALADALGWGDELRDLIKKEHARIDEAHKAEESSRGTAATEKTANKL